MIVLFGIDMLFGLFGFGFFGVVGIVMGVKVIGVYFIIYVMVGDGECNEGIVWEGVYIVNWYWFDNLIVILDYNKL